MHVVISRDADEKEYIDAVYLADHDSKSANDFDVEWERAKEQAMENNPEEWNVHQIIIALKRKGWRIMQVNPVKVTY